MSKESILNDIMQESDRIDQKWGADRNLLLLQWLGILAEEFGEVAKGVLETNSAKKKLAKSEADFKEYNTPDKSSDSLSLESELSLAQIFIDIKENHNKTQENLANLREELVQVAAVCLEIISDLDKNHQL